MLQEFKNNESTTQTTTKISSVLGQGIIIDLSWKLVFKDSFW